MRSDELRRRVIRQEASQAAGRPVGQPRDLAAHTRDEARTSDLLRLPVIPAEMEIVDGDGNDLFMLDYSALDSSDVME